MNKDQDDVYRDQVFGQTELEAMTVAVVQEICKSKTLSRTGKKTDLVAKILQSGADMSTANTPMQEVLMGCWFMSPIKSVGMKLGFMNEANIERTFPGYLQKYGNGLVVI